MTKFLFFACFAWLTACLQAKVYTNLLGTELQICSVDPMTGYYRDGYCKPYNDDYGKHLVCATMDKEFLDYTASVGNNLRSVVHEGENWCLCEDRWLQAFVAGYAPVVVPEATYANLRNQVKNAVLSTKPFQNSTGHNSSTKAFVADRSEL